MSDFHVTVDDAKCVFGNAASVKIALGRNIASVAAGQKRSGGNNENEHGLKKPSNGKHFHDGAERSA
ncbi:MAG: hypothetical protein LBS59_06645 [Puniceicoccales bacterium]|nr:hypothetical protein [Puniceicoccales bacterium]